MIPVNISCRKGSHDTKRRRSGRLMSYSGSQSNIATLLLQRDLSDSFHLVLHQGNHFSTRVCKHVRRVASKQGPCPEGCAVSQRFFSKVLAWPDYASVYCWPEDHPLTAPKVTGHSPAMINLDCRQWRMQPRRGIKGKALCEG